MRAAASTSLSPLPQLFLMPMVTVLSFTVTEGRKDIDFPAKLLFVFF
jgi:hypothetical protein